MNAAGSAPVRHAGAIRTRAGRAAVAAALSALEAGSARAAVLSLPPDAGAPPGSTTVVSLAIADASGILGADLALTCDPGVARPTGVSLTALSASLTLTFNEASPGVLKVSLFGIAPLAGAGSLIDITFASLGPAGSRTGLSLDYADLNEGAIPASVVGGSYCIWGTPAEATGLVVGLVPGSTVTALAWDPHPAAQSFNVYRASLYGATDLACLIPGVTNTASLDDGAVPQRGGVFYYLVTSVGCDGESIPGRGSDGTPIPNPVPCSP